MLKGVAMSLTTLSRNLFLYLVVSFIILKHVFSVRTCCSSHVTMVLHSFFLFYKLNTKSFDGEGLKARELNRYIQKVAWIHF